MQNLDHKLKWFCYVSFLSAVVSFFLGNCSLPSTDSDLIPAGCVSAHLDVASAPGLMDPHGEPFILLSQVVSEEVDSCQGASLTFVYP